MIETFSMETDSEERITRKKINQLENQLQKIMSERDEYRDRLLKERNSKVVAYMKPSITDNTPHPRKHSKKEHKKRHRVKQVSISSDRSDADSAVSSPGRTDSVKSYSIAKHIDIETSSEYSTLATTCSTCFATSSCDSTSDSTSVTRSTSASSVISENTTTCSRESQTDRSDENLAKTNNILLRAYLANALEKLETSEKERIVALNRLEETDVELSLEKSKNINLQDQIRSLSELKDKDPFVSIFDKIHTLESDFDEFERFTVSDHEESSEVVEQVVFEKSVQTCPDPKKDENFKTFQLKNLENQVIEMNEHLVRLSGQVFAEKMNSLKLTEKIVSLKTEINRSVSNIIHTNNQLQCSIYENARIKNSLHNFKMSNTYSVPEESVAQHQKGLIVHQQTMFPPMQIVNGRPMVLPGSLHYHYPPLPSFTYGKPALK